MHPPFATPATTAQANKMADEASDKTVEAPEGQPKFRLHTPTAPSMRVQVDEHS